MLGRTLDIIEFASAVANEHLTPLSASFSMVPAPGIYEAYYIIVTHSKLYPLEEQLSLHGLPESLVKEYTSCKVCGIAAKIIARLYPIKES